jgi:hypothetical protein
VETLDETYFAVPQDEGGTYTVIIDIPAVSPGSAVAVNAPGGMSAIPEWSGGALVLNLSGLEGDRGSISLDLTINDQSVEMKAFQLKVNVFIVGPLVDGGWRS